MFRFSRALAVLARVIQEKTDAVAKVAVGTPLNGRLEIAVVASRSVYVFGRGGNVLPFGDAINHGEFQADGPPPVDIAATSTGEGYWIVTDNGRVRAFGDAAHLGDASNVSSPIAGIAPTPSGRGYRLVTELGSVMNFGDARSAPSRSRSTGMPSHSLLTMNQPDQWRFQWPDGTWIRWNPQTQTWEKEPPGAESAAASANPTILCI